MTLFAQFLGFFLLNALTLVSSVIFAYVLLNFEPKSRIKLILSVVTIFFTQVFATQILLGLFALLNLTNLLIFNGAIVLFLFIWQRKKLKLLHLPLKKSQKFPWFLLISIFTPFILIFLLRYFNALFQVPLEYDNIAYHLPFVVEWFKTGDLKPIYYSAFAGPLGYYPSNFDLMMLWVVIPFGNDLLVNWVNFPVFPLLILAFYAVGRELGWSKKSSLLAAAFFLYMPQTFRQMGISLVDLFFALTFVLSFYFLIIYQKTKSKGDLMLFFLSAGLFCGTKYLGLPYAILPIAIAFFLILKEKIKISKKLQKIAIVPIGLIIGGGYWYLRNWIDTGNPLFPLEVKAMGITIFEGYHGLATRVLAFSLSKNITDFTSLQTFLDGFYQMVGAQSFLIIGLIVIFAVLPFFYLFKILLHRKKSTLPLAKKNFLISSLILLSLGFYFYFYWQAPYTFNNLIPNVRYAFMFLAIAALATGFLASRSKFLTNVLYFAIFGIILYNLAFLVITPPQSLFINDRILLDLKTVTDFPQYLAWFIALILLLGASLYWFFIRTGKKYFTFALITLGVFAIGSFGLIHATIQPRENSRFYFYDQWINTKQDYFLEQIRSLISAAEWFNQNAPDASIAYTGFNFHYFFFGRELQRNVEYININDCTNCRYKEFKYSPDSIRINPNYEHWLQNLTTKNKEYLVINDRTIAGVHIYEYDWATAHPNKFQLMFNRDSNYIFKIL